MASRRRDDILPFINIFCGLAIAAGLSHFGRSILPFPEPEKPVIIPWYMYFNGFAALLIGVLDAWMIYVNKDDEVSDFMLFLDFVGSVLIFFLFFTTFMPRLYMTLVTALCAVLVAFPVTRYIVFGKLKIHDKGWRVARLVIVAIPTVLWWKLNPTGDLADHWLTYLSAAVLAFCIMVSYLLTYAHLQRKQERDAEKEKSGKSMAAG